MQNWTWKNWLELAAALFGIWLLSYVHEWNTRNSGALSHAAALANWWGDVVMLQWVKSYQTLVAAIIAAAAAATVLFAAIIQSEQAEKQHRANVRRSNLLMLSRISQRWRTIWAYLEEGLLDDVPQVLAMLDADISELGAADPDLAHWSHMIASNTGIWLRKAVAEANKEAHQFALHQAQFHAVLGQVYFDYPNRLLGESGEIIQVPGDIASVNQAMEEYEVDAAEPRIAIIIRDNFA